MNANCIKGEHNYENNKIDAYICKDCGNRFTFDEVDEGKEKFGNLIF